MTPRAVGLEGDLRGHLVEPTCPLTQARVPGTAGRTRGPSDTGPSRQGLLVDPACPCTWTGFAQDGLSTPQALGHGPESPRRADRPRGETVGPQPGPVSPEKAGKPRGKSETSAILPEQLVETVGPQTRARFPGESWSTLRDLGPRPESPGTAGPHRGPSDSTASRPGQLVNTEGLRTRAPVARDKWSTPWVPGPGPESRVTAGRHRRVLGPGPVSPWTT